MSKIQIFSPTLAETAHATRKPHTPLPRLMAGLTVLAVGASLILATAIPVQADRPAAACVLSLSLPDHPQCPGTGPTGQALPR